MKNVDEFIIKYDLAPIGHIWAANGAYTFDVQINSAFIDFWCNELGNEDIASQLTNCMQQVISVANNTSNLLVDTKLSQSVILVNKELYNETTKAKLIQMYNNFIVVDLTSYKSKYDAAKHSFVKYISDSSNIVKQINKLEEALYEDLYNGNNYLIIPFVSAPYKKTSIILDLQFYIAKQILFPYIINDTNDNLLCTRLITPNILFNINKNTKIVDMYINRFSFDISDMVKDNLDYLILYALTSKMSIKELFPYVSKSVYTKIINFLRKLNITKPINNSMINNLKAKLGGNDGEQ